MARRGKGQHLSDQDKVTLIRCLLDCGGNQSDAAARANVGRDTIRLHYRYWQAGHYDNVPGMPDRTSVAAFQSPLVGSLKIESDDQSDTPPPVAEPYQVYQLRRQVAQLKKDNALLLQQQEEQAKLLELFGFINEAKADIPAWVTKQPAAGRKKQAIPTAFLSDVHLDEVVKPEQINYVNEYNRPIAEKRLRLFFDHTVELARDYLHGLTYEGLVLPFGGDLFSGIIHEELTETNAGTIFESLLYWAEPICAGVKLLRDAFGRVFIPSVPGNHGRRRYKPHAKNRAQDNFDWFFSHLVAKLLAGEKGITFAISEAADQPYTIFGTRYLLTHGDQFRGGSGIAGMLSPLMIGNARKREREQAVNRPYDYMIMGHWHQLAFVRGLIVNGAVKGYDEYAALNNFRFEPPQQAFWITDPVHGLTITAPIHVQAKDERYTASTGAEAMRSVILK